LLFKKKSKMLTIIKLFPGKIKNAYKPNMVIKVVLFCENHSTRDTFKRVDIRNMELAMEYKPRLGAERLATCFTSQFIRHSVHWIAQMGFQGSLGSIIPPTNNADMKQSCILGDYVSL
jgi:hypothetical protein